MINYRNRFHGHNSLRYVYRNGQVIRGRLLVCKYTVSKHLQPRMAIVVSKKVHKSAVGRNLIRRRLYEVLRRELPRIHPRTDIVYIVGSADIMTLTSIELTELVCSTLAQANLYITSEK